MKKLLTAIFVSTVIFTFGQQCDIEQSQIFEANQLGDGNVVFYSSPIIANNTNLVYKWEITLEDGMILSSVKDKPIFYISCNNKAVNAKLIIDNGSCEKQIQRRFQPKVCGTAGYFD